MLFQTKTGYPKEFIQRTVEKHHRRKEQPRGRPEEEPKQTKSINLPYPQGLSEQLKRALNKHNIKATFYTLTTLRSLLSKPKDHIPKEDRNNVVYQLNCKDREAFYVGEAKRTLNIRAEEHITAIKSASKKSYTAEHCWKYNHDFDWKHKKVLDFEKNWKTRTIKDSIISMEYPLNCQIFKNQYYGKAKQRKQPPKLQHHQTESTKVRQRL